MCKHVFSVFLCLFSLVTASVNAECVIGKDRLLTVQLVEGSSQSQHRATLESVTIDTNNQHQPILFKVYGENGDKWMIPQLCSDAMRKGGFTEAEIEEVTNLIADTK